MKRIPSWIWAAGLLLAVLLFNLITTPSFFSIGVQDGRLFGSLVDIVNRGAPVGLLALGMTLVIATGGVDLSVGAIMAICGAVAATMLTQAHSQPVGVIVVAAMLVGVICGLFNGFLVGWLELQPIVATLLLMVAGRGVAQLIAGGQIVTFHNASFESIATRATALVPHPIWILLIALGLFSLLTRRTAFGLFVEATGSNPSAARQVGLNARGIKIAVYALSGLAASIAGMIATADIKGADANSAGLYLELDAILAVSVGGTALTGGRFSLAGSIVGALLMQALTTTILTRGISTELTLVVKAVVVVAVCLLQAPSFRAIFKRSGKEAVA